MECQFCEVAHVLGPYVLVILFAVVVARTVKRFHEQLVQLHKDTVSAFDRHASSYERVHFDIIKSRSDDERGFSAKNSSALVESDSAPRKR
jgi:hypothetical protein